MAILSLSPSLLNHFSLSSPHGPNPIPTHPCILQGAHLTLSFKSLSSPFKPRISPISALPSNTTQKKQEHEQEEEEEDYRVLTATQSEYNNIVILQSQSSKVLLLDDSGNVHSILHKSKKWTNSYWDEFCSLPAIIPDGPVAIFGLGGGTVAHQLLHFWPSLILHGWELDEVLVDRARQFFNLSDLENVNESGGSLCVHVGDALGSSASINGGFSGIIVDLFADAQVLPQLERAQTWLTMREKLMPNGRIMVNCGGERVKGVGIEWKVNLVIEAMCEALGKHSVNWKKMPWNLSGNYMALTGALPELDLWSKSVPEKLSSDVKLWRPCE